MKCPSCGDTERQERMGPASDGQSGRRCARCGRIYSVPGDDLAEIMLRLDQMKAEATDLTRRRESLLTQISEAEAQAQSAREQLEAAQRQLRGKR